MMSKATAELQMVFREIEQSNRDAEKPSGSERIAHTPVRLSKDQVKRKKDKFLGYVKLFNKNKEQQEKLNAENAKLRTEAQKIVEQVGVLVREKDRALYVHPYKAQIEHRRTAGAIDAEIIKVWAKKAGEDDLIVNEVEETLDLVRLRKVLNDSTSVNPAVAEYLKKALEDILKVATIQNCVERHEDQHLDLELYDALKKNKEIPEDVIQKAESGKTAPPAFSIDTILDRKNRCGGCASKIGHATKKHPVTCKRCGTENCG